MYQIKYPDEADKSVIIKCFPGIFQLEEENRERVLTAYHTVLTNSTFTTLEEIPFSAHCTHYGFVDHVNEVVDLGLHMEEYAEKKWNDGWTEKVDREELLLLLLLHDIDKPLLLSEGYTQDIPHGVLGAMLLKELGFPNRIVALVATHSPKSFHHVEDPMAQILHYADLNSADHIYMLIHRRPFYFG
ncbi:MULTISPECIES: HD domain-containing protein [unclassified Clostridium]|uniref:HD domain-containing protein n=1 Tax=unclassified Clostridium TaxID=2614128 RepID=UPI00110758EF|nr:MULTISPECIES: HD domain-containing protein [unclassified Clostridium]